MATFGNKSASRLSTCHEDLQKICNLAIEYYDFSVTEGTRTKATQMKYFKEGKSKLDGINKISKHQSTPSMAVDIAPYPIKWKGNKSRARFYQLSGYMFLAAEILLQAGSISHKLRWGGDWDSDKDFEDQSFDDLPHFELKSI